MKLCNHKRERLALYFYQPWKLPDQPELERRYCSECDLKKTYERRRGRSPWKKVSQSQGAPLKDRVNQETYPMTETEEAKKGTL